MYTGAIKRILDLTLALLGLILLMPLFIALVFAIIIDSRGPVFFCQKRVGKDKKYFKIIKFRTMRADTPRDIPTHLLTDPGSYITRVGRFLRRSSLDELPQLLNVIRGEMSFVGPRPALYNQYDLIELRDKYNANSVRPGLTGLAQIMGRDELPIDVKAKYDGNYVSHISFGRDVKIVFATFTKVITGEGFKEGFEDNPGSKR